jgi:quercetin dioxygenase-like cupin family protein
MNRKPLVSLAFAATLAAVYGGPAQSAPPVATLMPADVTWKDAPIPGVQTAVISGDPTHSGLYVIRAKLGPGAKVMPHTHPDTRYDTVLSGELHFGFGETFDAAKATLYPAGTEITVPANVPHFAWVENGEAVLQEVGIGPSGHVAYKK